MKSNPETRLAKERGENSGLLDAQRHDKCPEDFEPTENPHAIESEAELFEAWEDGHENTFEGTKTK